ncbi:hypothetical protein NL427_27110, partial [Klebsiella pneumoniae]|nr:hypothetical protein [Klebsiella pneumoniae]
GAAAFSVANRGYIGTGYNGSAYFNDLWQYNPDTDAWTARAAVPGGVRSGATGFTIGTKGYFGFGTNGSSQLGDFHEYNPEFNSWFTRTA